MRLDDESLAHVRAWLVKADEDILADMDEDFRPYVDIVETWTDFAVEERYPGDLSESSPVDLSAGIALAIELRDLVAKKIAADLPD